MFDMIHWVLLSNHCKLTAECSHLALVFNYESHHLSLIRKQWGTSEQTWSWGRMRIKKSDKDKQRKWHQDSQEPVTFKVLHLGWPFVQQNVSVWKTKVCILATCPSCFDFFLLQMKLCKTANPLQLVKHLNSVWVCNTDANSPVELNNDWYVNTSTGLMCFIESASLNSWLHYMPDSIKK